MMQTYNADCFEVMKSLPDASADLAIIDPPYFRIMMEDHAQNKYDWDNQWTSIYEYIDWIGEVFSEVRRILRPQGSVYCFADDLICAHVQIQFENYFRILNNIVWYKPNNMTIKGWKYNRKFCPATERILFGEQMSAPGISQTGLQQIHSDPDCFNEIRDFFVAGKKRWMEEHNANTEQFSQWINEITGTRSVASRHYFAQSQYVFPTFEMYSKMRATGYWVYRGDTVRQEYEGLRQEYEGLRQKYEGLRQKYEGLRRPFNPPTMTTDVWTCPITPPSEDRIHPTQKPIRIIRTILQSSIRDNGRGEKPVILDPFMGSGQVGRECVKMGYDYIGIEKDPDMYAKAMTYLDKLDAQYTGIRRLEDWL